MSEIKRVAFLGGPGSGRSTLAADIFVQLKKHHFPVEYLDESAKLDAWQKKKFAPCAGLGIMARQCDAEEIVMNNGGIVVTSTCPWQNAVYSKVHNNPVFGAQLLTAKEYDKIYPALYFFVLRRVPFDGTARYQNAEQAKAVDDIMHALLTDNGVKFSYVDPTVDTGPTLEAIVRELRK